MHKCEACGKAVRVAGDPDEGTQYYELLDKRLDAQERRVPFWCTLCGGIWMPNYQPIRDVVFLYPLKPPETTKSGIWIPDEHYVGGNPRERIHPRLGVVLRVGPGYTTKKGVFRPTHTIKPGDTVFYSKVPWAELLYGNDNLRHLIVVCGFEDIWGLPADGEDPR